MTVLRAGRLLDERGRHRCRGGARAGVIYQDYYEDACADVDLDAYLDALAVYYDDLLDGSTMRSVTEFMRTPAGVRFMDASHAVTEMMQKDYLQSSKTGIAVANQRYMDRMQVLKREASR